MSHDKFKTRMFPRKIVNLSFFLSQALGQRPLWHPKRGTSVPPFLCMGRQGLRPLQPRDRRAPPYNPQLLKKLAKLLLVSTQLLRRDPPLRNARRRLVLRGHAPRLESPGTGRGRALAVSTGAAVAAGLGCRLGRCLTVPTGHQHPIARIVQSGHGPKRGPLASRPPQTPAP